MAFFRYYAENPRDLDLGFYLFRGGMKPHGLGKERDVMLNTALEAALHPIFEAARRLGAASEEAKLLMVDTFAHAAGLLLLAHTGRIRMFGVSHGTLHREQDCGTDCEEATDCARALNNDRSHQRRPIQHPACGDDADRRLFGHPRRTD